MVLKEKPKSSPKGKAKENQAVASGKEQDSVRKRVIEWEKERERLREMQRLEEFANERDDEQGDVSFTTTSLYETEENIQVAKVAVRTPAQIVPIAPSFLGMRFLLLSLLVWLIVILDLQTSVLPRATVSLP
jgi:hypothetical protein